MMLCPFPRFSAPDERFTPAHAADGQVDETEQDPEGRQDPFPVPAEQVGQGGEQVHPADLAEDSPPAGTEKAAIGGAVGHGKADKEQDTGAP